MCNRVFVKNEKSLEFFCEIQRNFLNVLYPSIGVIKKINVQHNFSNMTDDVSYDISI